MLEELSVRSNIALSQKNFVREVERDNEDLEDEYVALCAQVVSSWIAVFSSGSSDWYMRNTDELNLLFVTSDRISVSISAG